MLITHFVQSAPFWEENYVYQRISLSVMYGAYGNGGDPFSSASPMGGRRFPGFGANSPLVRALVM